MPHETEFFVQGGPGRSVSLSFEELARAELCEVRRAVDRMVVQTIQSREESQTFLRLLAENLGEIRTGNQLLRDIRSAIDDLIVALREAR